MKPRSLVLFGLITAALPLAAQTEAEEVVRNFQEARLRMDFVAAAEYVTDDSLEILEQLSDYDFELYLAALDESDLPLEILEIDVDEEDLLVEVVCLEGKTTFIEEYELFKAGGEWRISLSEDFTAALAVMEFFRALNSIQFVRALPFSSEDTRDMMNMLIAFSSDLEEQEAEVPEVELRIDEITFYEETGAVVMYSFNEEMEMENEEVVDLLLEDGKWLVYLPKETPDEGFEIPEENQEKEDPKGGKGK